MKSITFDIYKLPPSNKEFSNEPILENNTDHIDSGNEIVHELVNLEFEHLQQRYQHLLDQPPNLTEQTISYNQCSNSNESGITKWYKVIESNVRKPELHKVTPPLIKVPSCEDQIGEIRKKYDGKYITFTNNKRVLLLSCSERYICLIVGG